MKRERELEKRKRKKRKKKKKKKRERERVRERESTYLPLFEQLPTSSRVATRALMIHHYPLHIKVYHHLQEVPQ